MNIPITLIRHIATNPQREL